MAEFIAIQPSDFFNTLLYTGDGGTQAITGVGFTPNLTVIKNRPAGWQWVNWDTMNGAGDNTELSWNATNPIGGPDAYSYGQISVFGADGFTVAKGGSGGTPQFTNTSGTNYVSYNWKAATSTGVSGGTITPSSYLIDTTAGFGMYKYGGNQVAGATIAHGLGKVPKFILVKRTDSATSWAVQHVGAGATYYGTFNSTGQFNTATSLWNDTTPTDTVFSLGTDGDVNNSTGTYMAYVWCDVPGYSKMGSYKGNGSANGTFVYTGFRPALIITKMIDGTSDWYVFDSKRLGYNVDNNSLFANAADAEGTTDRIDLVSNGFKWRTVGANNNTNTFMYSAFAEFPMVSSNDIPGLAR